MTTQLATEFGYKTYWVHVYKEMYGSSDSIDLRVYDANGVEITKQLDDSELDLIEKSAWFRLSYD